MAKRPPLSEQSFLAHLFSPKKHARPTGMPQVHLSGIRGGRTKGRLAAFNRMSPVSQEALKRSGLREQYLRGEASLADAKRTLRPTGIRLGVARPVKTQPIRRPQIVIRTALDARVASHLKSVLRQAHRPVNPVAVDVHVRDIPIGVLPDVADWDYAQIKYAGRFGSEYETFTDEGVRRNPFWYHSV